LRIDPVQPSKFIIFLVAATALAGCSRNGELDSSGGINVTRSACPAVAIPTYTGDVTLFNPENSRDSRAIDVVANLTNVRATCDSTGTEVKSNATFDVLATRRNASGERDVALPYFATVTEGGRYVISKRLSKITLHFADGQLRASAKGSAGAAINRSAATLPLDIQKRITRQRKAGDADAATDPLADPIVKAAVERASFELLIGFQLSADQLQYNATR
jgi:hypothetical protein